MKYSNRQTQENNMCRYVTYTKGTISGQLDCNDWATEIYL